MHAEVILVSLREPHKHNFMLNKKDTPEKTMWRR